MKTKFFTLIVLAAFTCSIQHANATIRRVGFPGNALNGTDYATLQLANDNSISGDSIYIFPGSWYASITRKLVLVSYGYSARSLDSGLQNIKGIIDVNVTLGIGSTGCSFQGIDSLTVNAQWNGDSITISRCYVNAINLNYNNASAVTFKNWQVSESFINSFTFNYSGGKAIDLLVSNCHIATFSLSSGASGSTSGVLSNNIFEGTLNNTNFNNSAFTCFNNIFLCPNLLNIVASSFQNNVAINSTIPADGNKINVAAGNLFVGYPTQGNYSNDARYVLSATSPAIGAGEQGADCGIFGGVNPYHLGGIPPIPSFYKLTAPTNTASTNPYIITFSVRGNN